MRSQRDPTEDDAIAGVAARFAFEPGSLEECREVWQLARASRLALAVVGGKTETDLGHPPARLDAVVSSRRLDRVIEYAHADQVVVVEAGITLAALQAVLAREGQRLACDPPLADRATLGGLLSTNAFGPLRTRYGSLRDLLIGVSILRADGTFARGGGKVVKNVAGFDLPKLVVGALGTLGMIATATFRLHPLPEATATLAVRGLAPRAVRDLAVALRDAQIEPAAFVALAVASPVFDVLLRFEGFAAGVVDQRERTATLIGARGLPAELLSASEATAAWSVHDEARTRGDARVKISALAGSLEAIASHVTPLVRDALSGAATLLYPTLGLAFVTGMTGDRDGAVSFAAAIAAARARILGTPSSLVVHAVPSAMRGAIDVWGPFPAALSLMRRIKDGFDPQGRMNPGRFVGGL